MYVCVCNAVTERHIEQAVRHGARRMRDLRQSLGVAAECNRCAKSARQCLSVALAQAPEQHEQKLAQRTMTALTGAPALEPQLS